MTTEPTEYDAVPIALAIHTRWLQPTNYNGSRVIARIQSDGPAVTTAWDYSADMGPNHYAAALACIARHLADTGSDYRCVGRGESRDGRGYTFLFVPTWKDHSE